MTYFMSLVVVGLLLVPSAVAAIAMLQTQDSDLMIPQVAQRLHRGSVVLLACLAAYNSLGWLLRLHGVGLTAVTGWGWVILVVVAALLLTPTSLAALLMRNISKEVQQAVLSGALVLCILQVPYWLLLGGVGAFITTMSYISGQP